MNEMSELLFGAELAPSRHRRSLLYPSSGLSIPIVVSASYTPLRAHRISLFWLAPASTFPSTTPRHRARPSASTPLSTSTARSSLSTLRCTIRSVPIGSRLTRRSVPLAFDAVACCQHEGEETRGVHGASSAVGNVGRGQRGEGSCCFGYGGRFGGAQLVDKDQAARKGAHGSTTRHLTRRPLAGRHCE